MTSPPRLILLEGWCIGVPPEAHRALTRAVNALERAKMPTRAGAAWVNARLAGAYAQLWQRLDALIVLAAPDFEIVSRWRDEPERALRRTRRAARDVTRRRCAAS